jgi:hypothetical protein
MASWASSAVQLHAERLHQQLDWYPEYLNGGFEDFKDIALGPDNVDNYQPSAALRYFATFTVTGSSSLRETASATTLLSTRGIVLRRYFASAIHEFAQSLAKENFFLVGEVTGCRDQAVNIVEQTGIDAALSIDEVQDKLEYMIRGQRNQIDYFDLFHNSLLV